MIAEGTMYSVGFLNSGHWDGIAGTLDISELGDAFGTKLH